MTATRVAEIAVLYVARDLHRANLRVARGNSKEYRQEVGSIAKSIGLSNEEAAEFMEQIMHNSVTVIRSFNGGHVY